MQYQISLGFVYANILAICLTCLLNWLCICIWGFFLTRVIFSVLMLCRVTSTDWHYSSFLNPDLPRPSRVRYSHHWNQLTSRQAGIFKLFKVFLGLEPSRGCYIVRKTSLTDRTKNTLKLYNITSIGQWRESIKAKSIIVTFVVCNAAMYIDILKTNK